MIVDGELWVSRDDGTVSRIDPSDGRILGQVTIENMAAMVGAFDLVWVTSQAPTADGLVPGRLVRIDPDLSTTNVEVPLFDGECHDGDVPEDPDGEAWCPGDLTAGAGAIWVPLKDNGVAMIDPDTNEVTVIPVDDIGHEVLGVAVDGDVAYVASRSQVTSIVDGEVRATVVPGEFRYLGPMDGAFGVQLPWGDFQVLRANDPMAVENRPIAPEFIEGRPPGAAIDGEAWRETGRNYNLQRVELTPTG